MVLIGREQRFLFQRAAQCWRWAIPFLYFVRQRRFVRSKGFWGFDRKIQPSHPRASTVAACHLPRGRWGSVESQPWFFFGLPVWVVDMIGDVDHHNVFVAQQPHTQQICCLVVQQMG